LTNIKRVKKSYTIPKCKFKKSTKIIRKKKKRKAVSSRFRVKLRSKGEIFLVMLLKHYFPGLRIIENDRKLIKPLEIDILITSPIKLAIEYNGPGHYEPVYGESRFIRQVKRDAIKVRELEKLGYVFIIVDGRIQDKVERYADVLEQVRKILHSAFSNKSYFNSLSGTINELSKKIKGDF
jgi:hypothetical protein